MRYKEEFVWKPRKPFLKKKCYECYKAIRSGESAYVTVYYEHNWGGSYKMRIWLCENCRMMEML